VSAHRPIPRGEQKFERTMSPPKSSSGSSAPPPVMSSMPSAAAENTEAFPRAGAASPSDSPAPAPSSALLFATDVPALSLRAHPRRQPVRSHCAQDRERTSNRRPPPSCPSCPCSSAASRRVGFKRRELTRALDEWGRKAFGAERLRSAAALCKTRRIYPGYHCAGPKACPRPSSPLVPCHSSPASL
jgi:hypothetical protein